MARMIHVNIDVHGREFYPSVVGLYAGSTKQ